MGNITRRSFLQGSATATVAAASIGVIGRAASNESKLTVTKAPSHSMQGIASQNFKMEELANNMHQATWDQKFYSEFMNRNLDSLYGG